jgi:uncharacterized membrane protein YjgN (DUF898 family)
MSDVAAAPSTREPEWHPFEFRGTGGEFFRIWIVNLALTLITLGIYSAWAKVRTRRYFYGHTVVAGHTFDYHAVPLRILIGRVIALALFVGYNLTSRLSPAIAVPAAIVFVAVIPWLIVAAQRFNARNTSYRNVRFNFIGTSGGAFKAFLLWPIAGVLTLGGLMPLAHRARNYFYINKHTFGGRPFATQFPAWSIYKIYLQALLMLVVVVLLIAMGVFLVVLGEGSAGSTAGQTASAITGGAIGFAGWIGIFAYVGSMTFNLSVSNTVIDGRHRLNATLSPWSMVWIGVSNLLLILVTLGVFYPWARVRIARYMAQNMSLQTTTNLDEFTSEVFATQSAVGEEIAGFFDFDIGL